MISAGRAVSILTSSELSLSLAKLVTFVRGYGEREQTIEAAVEDGHWKLDRSSRRYFIAPLVVLDMYDKWADNPFIC